MQMEKKIKTIKESTLILTLFNCMYMACDLMKRKINNMFKCNG